MPPRVLEIGLPLNNADFTSAQFLSRRHFSEFDLIIWDPLSLDKEAREFAKRHGDKGRPLAKSVGEALAKALAERHQEVMEFLKLERDLIVMMRDVPNIAYESDVHRLKFIDLKAVSFQNALSLKGRNGQSVEWVGPDEISSNTPGLCSNLAYSAISTDPSKVVPLFRVPGSQVVVGGYLEHQWNGFLFFVPHTRWWDGEDDLENRAERTAYLEALAQLPGQLRAALAAQSTLPIWAMSFVSPAEASALAAIQSIDTRIAELQSEARQQQALVDAEEKWKLLFTAHDEPLVTAAIIALETLGIKAVRGPDKHADIVAAYRGRLAALEVKGKTRSAARNNVEQCRTWVSELTSAQVSDAEQRRRDTVTKEYLRCLAEVGVTPCDPDDAGVQPVEVKGVLMINAYREHPLSERTEPAFPHSLHRNITAGGLCALTTLQLLGMALKVRDDPSSADHLAQFLFNHVGTVSEFADWSSFLTNRNTLNNGKGKPPTDGRGDGSVTP